MGRSKGKLQRNESGQIAILFALVFTFMFILFGFVIDFGHVINSKINLQLAADSAAYAGAAWQARTLNQIAAVNYKMRQDIKELAMRMTVTHVRHNRDFPFSRADIDGPPAIANVELFACQQAEGYVAASGVTYDLTTNICRNASPTTGGIPPIIVPPVIASFDPFNFAIQAQIREIQKEANRECRAAAGDNKRLVEHLRAVYLQRSQGHLQQIQALTGFLNQVKNINPSPDSEHPLVASAYKSAFNNLARANKDDFRMQILQPDGNYVEVTNIPLRVSLPYFDFSTQGDGCVAIPRTLDIDDSFFSGVSKKRDVLTYFAVKLTSKPKLFFMPERWLEDDGFPLLEAISVAKPFGSRIGPEVGVDQLLPTPGRVGNASRFINFSFSASDRFGIQNRKIMAYLNALHPFNAKGRPDGNQNTGWPDPNKSAEIRLPLLAIQTPTLFDSAFFTVFPNPEDDTLQQDYLEPEFAKALYPDYLEAASANNETIQLPVPRTPAYLPAEVGQRTSGWIQTDVPVTSGDSFYGNYAIDFPGSHSVHTAAQLPEIADRASDFGFANREQVHSAWAPDGKPGRIGYSVKLIGMDHLVRSLRITVDDSNTTISNRPQGDPNIEGTPPKLLH